MENKKNNLVKQAEWYNVYCAIDEKGNAYELENIIIYSDCGVLLETDRGWFSDNNDLGDVAIGTIKRRMKKDFSRKENFIIKEEQKSYRIDNKYTLYIYYKNINCNFIGYSIDSLFLRTNFTILDNYKIDDVIGFTKNKSDSIAYSDELQEAYKKIDSYNFERHPEELEKAIKLIREKQKQYKKALEEEENYTLKDYKKMIRPSADGIDPYYIITNIKTTFGKDIEEMEALK